MIGFAQSADTAEAAFARKKARKRPSYLKKTTLDAVVRDSAAWLREMDAASKK